MTKAIRLGYGNSVVTLFKEDIGKGYLVLVTNEGQRVELDASSIQELREALDEWFPQKDNPEEHIEVKDIPKKDKEGDVKPGSPFNFSISVNGKPNGDKIAQQINDYVNRFYGGLR